ncbi:ABC transporter permease subunit [Labrys monachus]|uniref:Polar amino acid transport system permease protein n=1 Tax=Labrys monachus TaxID=217067 RepID=A0ABU0FHK9_9HYPH|nr:ABC transporter permease subunit [Labrys monachus]MDQ0393976.1 polar amino acid transport system permease protein [Labrys monachus]
MSMPIDLSTWFFGNFGWIGKYWFSNIVPGFITTLQLLFFSLLFGYPFAILVGFGRVSRNRFVYAVSTAFVSIIRGTPLLVQMFIYYVGLGSLFPAIPGIRHSFIWPFLREGYYYVIFALVVSVGAYVGEVMRGALLSVPRGELEAARAFGFRGFSLVRRIWLPRAMQAMMPTFAGETVLCLKSTALAYLVTVQDLLGQINIIRSREAITYTPLLTVAVGYLLTTLVIEAAFRRFEASFAKTSRAP